MFKISDTLKSTIRAKAQLYIGYFLLAAVLVLAAVATYNYVTRLKLDTKVTSLEGKLGSAEARVKAVEEVNEQQAQAIQTINRLTDVSDTMLQGLATDVNALRVRDSTAFNRLATLEKSNEAVRAYLNSAVPAPVGCVLDRTCADQDADGIPRAERGPAPAVRAAPAPAKPNQR